LIAKARYGHTNLSANDWRGLFSFYQEQFGCTPVPPERDFKGRDLERGTGISGAELRGEHLRLPGHGANGPTLEIFNYNILEEKPQVARLTGPGSDISPSWWTTCRPRERQFLRRPSVGRSRYIDERGGSKVDVGVCDRSGRERDRAAVPTEIETVTVSFAMAKIFV
jgi:hypothetical protein